MEQIGFPNRANFNLAGYPFCAASGHFFLLQAVSQLQPFVFNLEGLLVRFFRVKGLNELRLAIKKAQRFDAFQFFAKPRRRKW